MEVALICTDQDLWGLGIRLLSSVLKRGGHATRMIFLSTGAQQYSPEVIADVQALTTSCDIVGVSCYSRSSLRTQQLVDRLRRPHIPVLWGGLHATLNPEECAEIADIVCRGEGEETVLELAEALQGGRPWRNIQNLVYRENGTLRMNPVRPPFKCMDDLPLFDFVPADEYHLVASKIVRAPQLPDPRNHDQAIFIGSRGCAFHCTYCCNQRVKDLYAGSGRYLRRMSTATYVNQLETLRRNHFPNSTDFFLMDEDFFLRSLEELREFAQLYRSRIGIPFECMCSPATVTHEKVKVLVDAGLWRIRLGIESGSERTKREVYARPIPNSTVLRAAHMISKFKELLACYFFIIGNPYETTQDLKDTLQLMRDLPPPYNAHIYNLVFFPGSVLYERALRDGIISGPRDSAQELHFRGGLQYSGHPWKRKNLYLNALLYLAEGRVTRSRIGMLPRPLLPHLARDGVISWAEVHSGFVEALIAFKRRSLEWRARMGVLARRAIRHPGELYDLRLFIGRNTRRLLGKCTIAETPTT